MFEQFKTNTDFIDQSKGVPFIPGQLNTCSDGNPSLLCPPTFEKDRALNRLYSSFYTS